jgi:hypothetical protein
MDPTPLVLCPRAAWMLEDDSRSDAAADTDWHRANNFIFGPLNPDSTRDPSTREPDPDLTHTPTIASLRLFTAATASLPLFQSDIGAFFITPPYDTRVSIKCVGEDKDK